jgi:Ulp1 family protease
LEAARLAKEKRLAAERKAREDRLAAEREGQRQEQEQWNSQLESLGLRKPKASMISPISALWDQKVEESLSDNNLKLKIPGPESLDFTARDFGRIVPSTIWLHDNCVTAVLKQAANFVNDAAGVVIKQHTPKCIAFNTFFWDRLCTTGPGGKERMLKRVFGLTPDNFLDVETIICPVNLHHHWTFMIIRPNRKEISYVDSFHAAHEDRLIRMRGFLEAFLKDKYQADEWNSVQYRVPLQTNGYDCGVFTITNSIYLALGLDPSEYSESDMPLQRRRLAAAILNGGFTGDFDLSHL